MPGPLAINGSSETGAWEDEYGIVEVELNVKAGIRGDSGFTVSDYTESAKDLPAITCPACKIIYIKVSLPVRSEGYVCTWCNCIMETINAYNR